VVTGVQFWATEYLQLAFDEPISLVNTAFLITSITAPVGGVLVGGYVTDRTGGYKGSARAAATLYWCSLVAVLCTLVGIAAALSTSFWASVLLLWLLLFFGATVCLRGSLPAQKRKRCSRVWPKRKPLVFHCVYRARVCVRVARVRVSRRCYRPARECSSRQCRATAAPPPHHSAS
jgi:CDP-diglyceride synthetase